MATEDTTTGAVRTEQNPTGQQGAPATGNEPNGNASATQTQQSNDNGGSGDGGRTIDKLPKWAQEHIREIRQEAANYRTKAREYEEQQRQEQLSDDEKKVEQAVAEALSAEREKFTERIKRTEAQRALAEAKIINPQRSLRLIDLDKVTVEDDGTLKGLDEEIEALKNDYPNLIEGGNTNPEVHTQGNSTGTSTDMNDILRRMAGRA